MFGGEASHDEEELVLGRRQARSAGFLLGEAQELAQRVAEVSEGAVLAVTQVVRHLVHV
jgi:hypothetical protein